MQAEGCHTAAQCPDDKHLAFGLDEEFAAPLAAPLCKVSTEVRVSRRLSLGILRALGGGMSRASTAALGVGFGAGSAYADCQREVSCTALCFRYDALHSLCSSADWLLCWGRSCITSWVCTESPTLLPKWKWWTSERPEHRVWLSGCFVCPMLSSCLVWAWLSYVVVVPCLGLAFGV